MVIKDDIQLRIQRWELIGAQTDLEESGHLSDENDFRFLSDLLKRYKTQQDDLDFIIEMSNIDPDQALEEFDTLQAEFPEITSHPRFSSSQTQLQISAKQKRKDDAIALLNESITRIQQTELYDQANNIITQIQNSYPEWSEDNEVSNKINELEVLKKTQESQKLRVSLDEAIRMGRWTEGEILFNNLLTKGVENEKTLAPFKNKLDSIRTHAEGKSTKQTFGDEIENLKAALYSVQIVSDWRSAVNNQIRLRELYAGKSTEQLQSLNVNLSNEEEKLRGFINDLTKQTIHSVDKHLESAKDSLQKGHLDAVEIQLDLAERVGKKLPKVLGEPDDLAPDISLTDEQSQLLEELRGYLKERKKTRLEAQYHFNKALALAGNDTLSSIREAQNQLIAAATDETLPGLDIFASHLVKRYERKVEHQLDILTSRLTSSCNQGDHARAEKMKDQIFELTQDASRRQTIEVLIQQLGDRMNLESNKRGNYQATFNTAQENLDSGAKESLQNLIEEWQEVAFDKSLVIREKSILKTFLNEVDELKEIHTELNSAINNKSDLHELRAAAERFSNSSVKKRAIVLETMVNYWFGLSTQYSDNSQKLDCLRRAVDFAERRGDKSILARMQTELEQVQTSTKNGREIASTEKLIREYQQSQDYQGAIDYYEQLERNHPAKQDSAIATLVIQMRQKIKIQHAREFFEKAQMALTNQNYGLATDNLKKSLEFYPLTGVEILAFEIETRKQWESDRIGKIKDAFQVFPVPEKQTQQGSLEMIKLALRVCQEVEQNPHYATAKLNDQVREFNSKYAEWEKICTDLIEQCKKEVHALLDDGEIEDANNRLKELELWGGIPSTKGGIFSELRTDILSRQSEIRRIEQKLSSAAKSASDGEFDSAMRQIAFGSNLPRNLLEKHEKLSEKWTNGTSIKRQVENRLNDSNNLGNYFRKYNQCVPSPDEIDYLGLKELFLEFVQQIEGLKQSGLRDDHPLNKDMLFFKQWVELVMKLHEIVWSEYDEVSDLENRLRDLKKCRSEAERFLKVPERLVSLNTKIWPAWIEVRIFNAQLLLNAAKAVKSTTFSLNWLDQRNALGRLKNRTDIEARILENLLQKIADREKTRRKRLRMLLSILGITLIFFLFIYRGPVTTAVYGIIYSPTATMTLTPSPTLTVTLTPVVSPTSTKTLTPTVTPIPPLILVRYDNLHAYQLPSPNSLRLTNDPLTGNLNVVGYCIQPQEIYWLLIDHKFQIGLRSGDYGWVKVNDPGEIYETIIIDNQPDLGFARQLLDTKYSDIRIECPSNVLTPVP